MTAIELKKGEHLVRKGETSKAIFVVLKGSVYLKTEYNQITLGTGSVLGFMLGLTDEYVCDYVAAEDALIASYKYDSPKDYKTIFAEQPNYGFAFLCAAITQYKAMYDYYKALEDSSKEIADFVGKQYGEYKLLCSQEAVEQREAAVTELHQINKPEPIRSWEWGYFDELMAIPENHYSISLKTKKN